MVTSNKESTLRILFRSAPDLQNKIKENSWKQGDSQLIILESGLIKILSDIK